jgi:hypothetical protein
MVRERLRFMQVVPGQAVEPPKPEPVKVKPRRR